MLNSAIIDQCLAISQQRCKGTGAPGIQVLKVTKFRDGKKS